jgi:hypothetical protein
LYADIAELEKIESLMIKKDTNNEDEPKKDRKIARRTTGAKC